ncbi:chemotaxis protein CheA [Chitiniphilus eburneus]|uniref:Chemotaxis protein CheA n=1 Tax=Chitiniphilus eburneus TaxID=2571148 RepID=A0A4U0QBL0_9NEIS|nr:chemotaxis protein CheA [Chitiniphilus eburneus]TJZ78749.1 chemotaxis protein CheA [Chitiniphilus eburneus]
MDPLLAQFLDETREHLLLIGQGLEQLARNPARRDAIEAVHRAAHTIKGSCGLFGFEPILEITHAAETCLGDARDDTATLTPPQLAALLAAFDDIADWLERLDGTHLPPESDAVARRHVATLAGRGAVTPVTTSTVAVPQALRDALRASGSPAGSLLHVCYTPDPDCFFSGEDPLYTLRQLPGLVALHLEEPAPQPLAGLDPYRCRLVLHALSDASPDDVTKALRTVASQVSIAPLPALPVVLDSGPQRAAAALLTQQRSLLRHAITAGNAEGALRSIATVLRNCCTALGWPEEAAHWQEPLSPEVALQRLDDVLARLAAPEKPHVEAPAPRAEALRIDPALIDRLLDVTTELGVSRTALADLARRAQADPAAASFGRELWSWHTRLDRDLRDLQAALQEARLVPLSEVFERLPRQARQLARQLDKKVALHLEGEGLRVDKSVAAALHEPMIHLLRNAIDHGLEPSAERLAAGKPAEGTLTVRASQVQDRLLIEVADDGRGIDSARIRQRAAERGVLDAAQLAALPDEAALQLVFEPGFSTAATVTEVSGRGVGMDVVRTAVGALGGAVSLSARPGEGTTLALSLPVQLALAQVVVVEVARQRFGVPLTQLLEVVRPQPDDLRRLKRRDILAWRDEVLPLVSLSRVLGLPVTARPPDAAVVLHTAQGRIALAVDAVGDSLDIVVKPLTGLLAGLPCYDGSALLADGSVLLVLNPQGLL